MKIRAINPKPRAWRQRKTCWYISFEWATDRINKGNITLATKFQNFNELRVQSLVYKLRAQYSLPAKFNITRIEKLG